MHECVPVFLFLSINLYGYAIINDIQFGLITSYKNFKIKMLAFLQLCSSLEKYLLCC